MIEDESNGVCEPVSPSPVVEAVSPSQRPRRNVHQKAIDYTNYGLLWREEKELKKALYASLNETGKKPRTPEMGEPPITGVKSAKKTKQTNGNSEANQNKKAKVHAQRKFAQGSTPNSPIPTPLKMCSASNITAVDVFPCRRPKTEDFLTFLCLRGTPILPPSLDFFNNWSRDDSCSEKSYFSEPDNFQEEVKDADANKFNFKSSSDMSSFHRQASAKLTAVKQKLNSRHSDIFQDREKNVDSKKRKSSTNETPSSSKKIALEDRNSPKTDQNELSLTESSSTDVKDIKSSKDSSNIELNSTKLIQNKSLNALKEKYKKQLLEKKSNPNVKPRQNLSNEKENKKELSLTKQVLELPSDKKANKGAKINAIKRERMKKSLEKRKSLRSARKITEMTPTYLEVSLKNQSSTKIRRAKLVPPIVEVDSDDSEYEEKIPVQTKDSLKTKQTIGLKLPPDSSKVVISNNLKHQMVLNQKPIVKLNNIALLCGDHSFGKSSTNSSPTAAIVIPKPKIITTKTGLALTSPCRVNIKVERVSSVHINHAANLNSTTPSTKTRQPPLSPTYKPPNNIVIGESKRCTRSQKQKEIESESSKEEDKPLITLKRENLVQIKKEESLNEYSKKSGFDAGKKSSNKSAETPTKVSTKLLESSVKQSSTKIVESSSSKQTSSKLLGASTSKQSSTKLVEISTPKQFSKKLGETSTSKQSLLKLFESSSKQSPTKLVESCVKQFSIKLVESPSSKQSVTQSSSKLVESSSKEFSTKLVENNTIKESSPKLAENATNEVSLKLVENSSKIPSKSIDISPSKAVPNKLVETPTTKQVPSKLDEIAPTKVSSKLAETPQTLTKQASSKLVETPTKQVASKLVETPPTKQASKLVETSPTKQASSKLAETSIKQIPPKLVETSTKQVPTKLVEIAPSKLIETLPPKTVSSKLVETAPSKPIPSKLVETKQSPMKLVEIPSKSSSKLVEGSPKQIPSPKLLESPSKITPTKLVETPKKSLSKILEREMKDPLRDKVKPIVKQIKEDLMPKHKVIHIDSTTEEESEDDGRSSDDSFLLSSFVKSTIAKLKRDQEIVDKKDDPKLTKNKLKPNLSKKCKSDKKSAKRSKSSENLKKSKTASKLSTNTTPNKKKLNKKLCKTKKKKESKISTKFNSSFDVIAIKDYERMVISDSSSEEELLSSDSSISVILPRPNIILSTPSTSKEAKTEETEQNSSTSYIIENVTRGTANFDNISNEMAAATLPGELMFGTAEEIQGLMTSEFSGVFDENFPAGAILLTARDPLTQGPLHLMPDVHTTPTKTVVDASTQCEDDILLSSSDSSKDCDDIVEIISSSSTSPEILSTSTVVKKSTPLTKSNINKLTPEKCSPIKSSTFSTTSSRNKVKNLAKKVEPFPGPNDAAKLVEAPVYAPTIEEFQDPLEFIKKIRPEAEKYGICRIIPPSTFKPECKINDDMRFTAHNQYIHKMLDRWGPNRLHAAAIRKHLSSQGIKMEQAPLIGGIEMDLSRLYQTVQSFGGLKRVMEKKKWQKIADTLHIPKAAQDRVNKLYDAYCKYLVSYATLPKEEKEKLEKEVVTQRDEWIRKRNARGKESTSSVNSQEEDDEEEEDDDDEGNDCVTKGRSMSISAFYRVARNTMSMWYRNQPLTEEVEKDYWKLVTERSNHVVVHAGNIDSSVYGSGFPTNRNSHVSKHPWNLKVLTNNPGSILRSMGPVSGVTIPTLHVGMLFTTGCWYRDIHELPWIEYSHTGADKIWYSVPHSARHRFRRATTKIMPDACRDHPIWLPSDTAMVPPSLLIENGSPLCRTVQESGQFVVIFPSAFTSTVCTGYAVSESVYFAPPSWLEIAQTSFQDIQNSSEPPVFSLERLLFSIANDSRTQKETLIKLLPLIKHIRDRELCSRKQLFDIGLKVSEKLALYEAKTKKPKSKGLPEDVDHECEVCRMHCYISMVMNVKDETVFCLEHGYQSVQKKEAKSHKLLYTYDQSELNELVRKVSDMIRSNGDKGGNASASAKKKSRKKQPVSP